MVKQKKDSKEREDTYYYIARLMIMVFCAFSAAVAFVTGVENAFTV